jgi:hypothetical protein
VSNARALSIMSTAMSAGRYVDRHEVDGAAAATK